MTEVSIYDLTTDTHRPVTQEDVDQMVEILAQLSRIHPPLPVPPQGPFEFTFRLAIYQNPMRSDGVFVAEDKPRLPYEGVTGTRGERLYPATPQTPYALGRQVDVEFARELVRRWNAGSAFKRAIKEIKDYA